ncbi:hypothetical protein DINM_002166 [Dirofilaria immitis]|nr:hypothetical protein [Dirofilaria immitis]
METNEDCYSIFETKQTEPVGNIINNDADDNNDNGIHRGDESHFGMMRGFGDVKSVGAIRKQWHRPVAEVFPNIYARGISKDSSLWSTISPGFAKHISNNSSFIEEHSPIPPPSLTHSLVDANAVYRIGISESSSSFSSDKQQQSMLRKSCPDLRISNSEDILSKNMEAYRIQNRNRRAYEKKQAALWKKKPIAEWSLDDVLLWLQHCKLDDVASIMIGYDINGTDVERWNNDTLEQLGIAAKLTRNKILHELQALKIRQTKPSSEVNESNGTKSKISKPLIPLFKLVRSTSYDKVVALETPLTTRDITVAEGRFGCLQVTKVNGANIPLREQDCFLEINEMPGQVFRSPLMFTKLVTKAAGEPIRLVVLRRRLLSTDDAARDYDYDNDTSGRGTFLEKPFNLLIRNHPQAAEYHQVNYLQK